MTSGEKMRRRQRIERNGRTWELYRLHVLRRCSVDKYGNNTLPLLDATTAIYVQGRREILA
jgi:hypothetical protein